MLTVTVQVMKAILTRNTDIGKLMVFDSQQARTHMYKLESVNIHIGDMPEWNQSFNFDLSKALFHETLYLIVKDEDKLTSDIVGEASIDVNLQATALTNAPQWHSLKYKNKPAGKVMIKISTKLVQLGYQNNLLSHVLIQQKPIISTPTPKKESQIISHSAKLNQTSFMINSVQKSNFPMESYFTGKKGIRSQSTQLKNLPMPVQFQNIPLKKLPNLITINFQSKTKI